MNVEQLLQARAQGGIIGAGLVQKSGALAASQFQCRAKEGHFAIGVLVHGC
jgi:hypothetical protein